MVAKREVVVEPHLVEAGARLAAARERLRMSQGSFALKTGIPRTTIIRIERGEVDTSWTNMVILAHYACLDLDELAAPSRERFCP